MPMFLLHILETVAGFFHLDHLAGGYNGGVPRINPAWQAENRYTAWDLLPNQIKENAIEYLDYSEFSWNFPGINPAEQQCYDDLTYTEQEGVHAIGLDEDDWDCWVNHYDGYEWWEMEEEGVAECYEVLGWNEANWENEYYRPATEDMYWSALSREQQAGASCVCFFEDLWDGEKKLDEYILPDFY